MSRFLFQLKQALQCIFQVFTSQGSLITGYCCPKFSQWILVKIFFTKINDFTTLVGTASGTEPMRQFWFTTFRAGGNGGCGQSVMGTTNSGTGMRVSSFR